MLSFFIGIQYIGIVIVFLQILTMLSYRPSRLQNFLLIMEFAILVNHVGSLMMMQAKDPSSALMAVKFSYVGKPYILLMIVLFFLGFYRVHIPAFLPVALFGFHIFISALVMTCEKHHLFYTTVNFVDEGYFPHLVFGHGIFYILNTILMAVYMVVCIVVSKKCFQKLNTKNEKTCARYLDAIIVVAALGLIVYFTGITGGYDTTLLSYVVGSILIQICVMKYDMLDAVEIARDKITEELAQGILVVSVSGEVIYQNPQIQRIFSPDGGWDTNKIFETLQQNLELGEKLCLGENIYEVNQKDMIKGGIGYGKMYIVNDVTANHNHALELERQMVIAETANKAKSDFLARMSHEIRTPINAVIGMDEMILRESRETAVKKYAQNIKSAAHTLLSLINDILDSSKIESGKMEIVTADYELDSLLNDVVNAIYLKAADKDLDFKIVVDEKLPNGLHGDDVRIRQILVNILNNAVKYTNEGGITFTVLGRSDGDREILRFEVKDTGIGIKEEDLPKLCAAFERIELSRNRNVEGTGLGMSIVSDLLHMMDSQLHVESIYGEGSNFYFELEQRVVDPVPIGDFQDRVNHMCTEDAYQSKFCAPRAKLLLVDDNDVNREVFRSLLKQTRVQIVDVNSGARCLEEAAKERFDIIFLDHMMPDMDGIETLQHLREMENCPCKDTPIVALTANAVTGSKEKYLAAGFDSYLSKPIISEKLEYLIMELLPDDLVEEGSAEVLDSAMDESEALPQISQIDWNYAHIYVKDDHVLEATLKNIYRALDSDQKELTELVQNIYNEEGIAAYRIKVHALKSTNASVGAVMVSQLAKLLEQRAIAGDTEAITRVHPVFMEELRQFEDELRSYYGDSTVSEDTVSLEQISQMLDRLIGSLECYDYDTADELVEKLASLPCEEKLREHFQKLQEQEFQLEFDACREYAAELKTIIEME